MLKAKGITKRFRAPGGWVAVAGLLGPSGSGKSTLARILPLLLRPDSGAVELDGVDIKAWGIKASGEIRRSVQLVWQSPRLASDSRLRLKDMIFEPLAANGMLSNSSTERQATLDLWSERVGLTRELLSRHPHAVSEGQLQRACLARALVLQPRYLICDELTSSLNVSTQAALLKVISDEQGQRELGVLLITHDRVLANHWCTRIVEIRNGKLVEED
jgi:peptide/nickel transport system ATP-binding protein